MKNHQQAGGAQTCALTTPHDPAAQEAARRRVKRCLKRKARLLGELSQAAAKSRREGQRKSRQILLDRDVAVAAVAEVVQKQWAGPKGEKFNFVDFVAHAEQLDLWKASDELVLMKPILKGDGKHRWVFQLDTLEAARSRLLLDILARTSKLHPRQFIRQGGIPALEAWLQKSLGGLSWVITTDIPRCFDSLLRGSVDDGHPLPGAVRKAGLYDPMDRAVPLVAGPNGKLVLDHHHPSKDHFVALSSDKRGIPQGAAFSSIVSELVIKKVLEAVEASTEGVLAASFGDNLILLLTEASDRALVRKTLMSIVAEHFGQDVLSELSVRYRETVANEAFVFCGRTYRLSNGILRRHSLPHREERYLCRLAMRMSAPMTYERLERAKQSVLGWMNHGPHSNAAMSEAAEYLTDIMSQLASLKEVEPAQST